MFSAEGSEECWLTDNTKNNWIQLCAHVSNSIITQNQVCLQDSFALFPLSVCCTRTKVPEKYQTVPEKKRGCFIPTCTSKICSQERASTSSLSLGLSDLTAHTTLKNSTNLHTAKRHQSPNTTSVRKTKRYFQTTLSLQKSVFLGAVF